MPRKKFVLNLPFRQIRKSDSNKRFENEFFEFNHITMTDLVSANKKNQYVFVYDNDSEILAFLVFKDTGTHFHLVLVETNRMFKTDLKPARQLIILIENLSKHFDYHKITLYSVVEKIPLYHKLGYEKTGQTVLDPTYGKLTMMKKELT